jgi:hypothetical protein
MLAENLQTWAQKERKEGRQEGQRLALQKLLQLKFGELPEWANQQIEQANSEQIDQWMSKILEEESLEALFQKH